MRILLIGARGFLGARLAARLEAEGHVLRCPGRAELDLARAHQADWPALLQGVEAVVNAAGLLRGAAMEAVHHHGPAALFEASAAAGIPRLVQISALGAAVEAGSDFLRGKGRAEAHLLRLRAAGGHDGWCVLRPSLVVGRGGGSTGLFAALAALPVPLRLAEGRWPIQPLHVGDLCAAVVALLAAPRPLPASLDLVGPAVLTTDALTATLRRWLGLAPRPPIALPAPLLRLAARLGAVWPGASLTPETLAMLAAGSTGDPAPAEAALGWRARPLPLALAAEPAVAADRWHARL
ncbi:hypothetical protein BKE38_28085, partial [Pseudoroseomonas deserti]